MKLEYGEQISPSPIKLTIGTLVKRTLRDVADISFQTFAYYQALLKLTPQEFYCKWSNEEDKKFWDNLTAEEKVKLNMFDVIVKNDILINQYLEMFNFFFEECVLFCESYFVLLNKKYKTTIDVNNRIVDENKILEILGNNENDLSGAINDNNFSEVVSIIGQMCGILEDEESEEPKFKNEFQKKWYYENYVKAKKKALKESVAKDKVNLNLTLPNLISAVASKHPSLNYLNIWDLTIYQFLDTFNRVQANAIYDINAHQISVWGDEDKKFDFEFWFKNSYDKK